MCVHEKRCSNAWEISLVPLLYSSKPHHQCLTQQTKAKESSFLPSKRCASLPLSKTNTYYFSSASPTKTHYLYGSAGILRRKLFWHRRSRTVLPSGEAPLRPENRRAFRHWRPPRLLPCGCHYVGRFLRQCHRKLHWLLHCHRRRQLQLLNFGQRQPLRHHHCPSRLPQWSSILRRTLRSGK